MIENLHLLLKPFAQHTTLVSGEEYLLCNSVLWKLNFTWKVLELTAVFIHLQSELNMRFKRYTDPAASDHELLFLVSALLDPQFKLLLNPTQTISAKNELCLLKDANEESSHSSSASSPSHESDEQPNKRFCHLSRLWSIVLKMTGKELFIAPTGEQELEQYLQDVHEIEAHLTHYIFG